MTGYLAQTAATGAGGWYGLIAAVIVALFTGGFGTAILTPKSTPRSLDTASLRKVAHATVILLVPMRAEIERLETRVSKLSTTAQEATEKWEQAEQRVRMLTAQAEQVTMNYRRALQLLQENGIAFPWDPTVSASD